MAAIYLRECLIENIGPIASLDLSFEMNAAGNPKPVILVGKNGTGKTILLAHVIDALAELAKQVFQDIVIGQRVGHMPFLKLTSGGSVRSLTGTSVCLIEFSDECEKFEYVEIIGVIDPQVYTEKLGERFKAVRTWPTDKLFHKLASGETKKVENYLQSSAVCFFPSSRHELPHWLNMEAIADQSIFDDTRRMQGILNKPLIIERAAEENLQWIMAVMLDSLIDADIFVTEPSTPGGISEFQVNYKSNLRDKLLLQSGRKNVERILKEVLEDQIAELSIQYRNNVHGHLAIRLGNGIIIPSLSHLSAGQALLFNLFATIIRYADRGDITKSFKLEEIEGMIIVDEIDAHLHSDLQYEVLPKIIKLFPKIQFILTSHSPLFLLGMEREFGEDGIQIVEMPSGQQIGTERFEEFRRSFEFYRQTTTFEAEIKRQVAAVSKPLVLTEGQTDVLYIREALEVLGHSDLLEQLEIDEVGKPGEKGTMGGGHTNLDAARKFLETNQNNFPRGVLLLHDCDTKRKPDNFGRVFVRSIPQNPERSGAIKGIENLIPPGLFEDRFYQKQEKPADYGGMNTITTFKKNDFCDWICKKRHNAEDFRHFESLLVPILREFVTNVS